MRTEKLEFLMSDDGKRPLVVLRPKDPELALRLAYDLLDRNDCDQEFQNILARQDYEFVGYAVQHRTRLTKKVEIRAVDTHGNDLGKLKAGDSLASSALVALPEIWPKESDAATS